MNCRTLHMPQAWLQGYLFSQNLEHLVGFSRYIP